MKRINYNEPYIDKEDVKAVTKALTDSHIITRGKYTEKFEEKLSEYSGKRFTVTFNSATSALECLGEYYKDKKVVVSANTFIASTKVAKNKENLSIADTDLKGMINVQRYDANVIVGVDYSGAPAPYNDLVNNNTVDKIIIADAAHSLGISSEHWIPCEVVVFSFNAIKTITTMGEGGSISTDNIELYNFAKGYRNQSFNGGNYHLTEAQSAMGLSQLNKINYILEKRKILYNMYRDLLGDYIIKYNDDSSNHLCVYYAENATKVKLELNKHNIYPQKNYKPIKNTPYAINFYKNQLSLPLHCNLTKDDVHFICKIIKNMV